MSITGIVQLPKMEGTEIKPGIVLMAEPIPIKGTVKFSCLANIFGALGIVELSIKFPAAADNKGEQA